MSNFHRPKFAQCFGEHQPLNRQSERYAREGIDLSLSTLADQVGDCATVLQPLYRLIERHVLAAERLHHDDTTVPILAKGQTIKGDIWTYVRDDRHGQRTLAAGRALLRLARSKAGASHAASPKLHRHPAGRCL